jgi:S-(hydroxymethyl)glutathione synthase
MKILDTDVDIDAPPQTVWAVMDNLPLYPEWNRLVPDLAGLTTVGQSVTGTLKQDGVPDIPLNPVLTRIVGARELRWLTEAPEAGVFRAEHIFVLAPNGSGGTRLIHNEEFDGAAVADMWEPTNTLGRSAYNRFNRDLKVRAEAYAAERPAIHPAVDEGVSAGKEGERMVLRCACGCDRVEVAISSPPRHNHLCGCSKCWKPAGALFAQIAVVPREAVQVTAGADRLEVVDPSQSVKRHACRSCGTHMVGTVEDPRHHFYGLAFVHIELAQGVEAPAPEFAAFASSLIETGTDPARMGAIRARLSELGIPVYDAFSPELMDVIAWHRVKLAKSP